MHHLNLSIVNDFIRTTKMGSGLEFGLSNPISTSNQKKMYSIVQGIFLLYILAIKKKKKKLFVQSLSIFYLS